MTLLTRNLWYSFDDFGGGDEFMHGDREGLEDRVMREHQEGNLHRADHGLARRVRPVLSTQRRDRPHSLFCRQESSFGMPFGQDQLGSITSGTKSHSENRKRGGEELGDDEDQDEGYAERNRVKREPKKPKVSLLPLFFDNRFSDILRFSMS